MCVCGEEVRCVPTTCACSNLTSLWSCFALIDSASHTHTHTHTWKATDVMWQLLRPPALMWRDMWRYYPFCDPIKHRDFFQTTRMCCNWEAFVTSQQRTQWISVPLLLVKNYDYFQAGFLCLFWRPIKYKGSVPCTQLVVKTDKPRPKITQLVEPLCSTSDCLNKQLASAIDVFKLFREICKWLA